MAGNLGRIRGGIDCRADYRLTEYGGENSPTAGGDFDPDWFVFGELAYHGQIQPAVSA